MTKYFIFILVSLYLSTSALAQTKNLSELVQSCDDGKMESCHDLGILYTAGEDVNELKLKLKCGKIKEEKDFKPSVKKVKPMRVTN